MPPRMLWMDDAVNGPQHIYDKSKSPATVLRVAATLHNRLHAMSSSFAPYTPTYDLSSIMATTFAAITIFLIPPPKILGHVDAL